MLNSENATFFLLTPCHLYMFVFRLMCVVDDTGAIHHSEGNTQD